MTLDLEEHFWARPSSSKVGTELQGFMVSPTLSLGHRNDYRFHSFVVSWFRGFAHSHLLVIKMTRFHSFMVSLFHSLPSLKMTVGFVVSRFHGFAFSVSRSPK